MFGGSIFFSGSITLDYSLLDVHPNESLVCMTAASLKAASIEEQHRELSGALFPLVRAIEPRLASKGTGVLLDLEIEAALDLVDNPEALRASVEEAVSLLRAADDAAQQDSAIFDAIHSTVVRSELPGGDGGAFESAEAFEEFARANSWIWD